jgi:predicted CXXCH cytochrome family protein
MKREKSYILLLMFLLMGVVLHSCVTKSNYRALSYFFDGVPNPDSTSVQKLDISAVIDPGNTNIVINTQSSGSVHPPYADRDCSMCHDRDKQNKLISNMPDICYMCHDNFSDGNKTVHGPVAGGNCTQCHDPHKSKYKKMLLDNSQELCFKCHQKEDVMNNLIHSDIDSMVCWNCHDPHSSTDKLLLK